ncbi:MAG: type II toxin-antitoxin system RelB/DinJ family antitoxin [Schwartzia sp.]|nr:type II toxin-antitoxin system RelB/DinJ family antitoxin [Schwartzia sp. (in: firmicutes)]
MPAVSTNIKIDSVVKQQAQVLFESLGMSLSTAVNIFLKQSVREQAIPFRIGDPFYSPANMAYLKKVTEDIDSGRSELKAHELLED